MFTRIFFIKSFKIFCRNVEDSRILPLAFSYSAVYNRRINQMEVLLWPITSVLPALAAVLARTLAPLVRSLRAIPSIRSTPVPAWTAVPARIPAPMVRSLRSKIYLKNKDALLPRLLIRKHEKVSKINVFKGREHGTKSKNLILTGTKGADVKISALFLSPRHRQPPYGVFSYPCLYPPEKCIN